LSGVNKVKIAIDVSFYYVYKLFCQLICNYTFWTWTYFLGQNAVDPQRYLWPPTHMVKPSRMQSPDETISLLE